MNHLIPCLAVSLLLATNAIAAPFHIDSKVGATVEVYVDQTYIGAISANNDRQFNVAPGYHKVKVFHPSGFNIIDERMYISGSRRTDLTIQSPKGTLVLNNSGIAPLFVQVNERDSVWMLPGSTKDFQVNAGSTTVVSRTIGLLGLQVVDRDAVTVLPSRTTHEKIAFTPNRRGEVVIQNADDDAVRVYLNGKEVGQVPTGLTRSFSTTAGNTQLVVAEVRGRILRNSTISIKAGRDTTIRVGTTGPAAHNRPSPRSRPDTDVRRPSRPETRPTTSCEQRSTRGRTVATR